MSDDGEIQIFKALDWIRDNAAAMASAKADRVQLEEFRKSKKAMLMVAAEKAGHNSAVAQEREAYANAEYVEFLNALGAAVEKEEKLRWLMIACQARIEVWRSLESSKRIEKRVIP
jgi:hypothetical protein